MSVRKIVHFVTLLPAFFLLYCGRDVPLFDENISFAYLEQQMAFGPRNPGSKGHAQCREWLTSELGKFAPRVMKQDFTHYDPRLDSALVMTNIIASFDLQARQRILLCAHWDTRPFADQDKGDNARLPVPGANDGASGVAVLMEMARLMKHYPPPLGVDIVFFDGEDYGPEGHLDEYFLGSRYFTKSLNKYRPRYGILLDMVGDAQLNLPVEYHSRRYASTIVDKVWSAAEGLGYTAFDRNVGTAVNDDHIPLNQAGIPCIDIIDFQYPDKSHKYWHTLEDTADKCSPQSLKIVGQTLLQVIYNEEV